MKPHCIIALLGALLIAGSNALSQTPAGKPLVGGPKPTDAVPGFIVRVHLGDGKQPKENATHLLCIVQDGHEWFDKYRPIAAAELRGVTTSAELNYYASGFIMVDKETEVLFVVKQNTCNVAGKHFGYGTYRHTFKKGKYPIEIYRHYGHGLETFKVSGVNGEQVVFHTGEMLSRELNRSEKIERKTYKSKLLGEAEAKQ